MPRRWPVVTKNKSATRLTYKTGTIVTFHRKGSIERGGTITVTKRGRKGVKTYRPHRRKKNRRRR